MVLTQQRDVYLKLYFRIDSDAIYGYIKEIFISKDAEFVTEQVSVKKRILYKMSLGTLWFLALNN